MTYHHEFDDERGGGDEDRQHRADAPWRPLDPRLQALLDHIEAEGITALSDEQLYALQEAFGVREPSKRGGAGTLRFNLAGDDDEVRRLLLERGWMFYGCGHWHKDSAGDVLGEGAAHVHPCATSPAQSDDDRGGALGETPARGTDGRNEHPH